MKIESKNNSKLKMLTFLQTKKGRKERNAYLIEGMHMVREAVLNGVELEEIFVAESAKELVLPKIEGAMCDITTVSDEAFAKVSNTINSQGVLAVAKIPAEEPVFAGNKFLVLDRIQDPGNMGTIIRTAAATGFVHIICVGCVDVFNPKVVRSSSSGLFFVKLHTMTEEKLLEFSRTHTLLTASAEGENVFEFSGVPESFGLVIGNEANGVSENIKNVSKVIALPMDGKVESLNAAVSASVLMYVLSFCKK